LHEKYFIVKGGREKIRCYTLESKCHTMYNCNMLIFLVHFLILSPRISCKESVYDFGRVEEGTFVLHTFLVKNSGDETLKILKVWTSCGCTAANTGKRELLPGDSTTIKVRFNTKGYRAKTTKAIFIKSNDPENSIFVLKLTGFVEKHFVDPEELLGRFCIIFDLRTREQFEKMHILGSEWIPKDKFKQRFEKLFIPKEVTIVLVYSDEKPMELLSYLRDKGYKNSFILRDGFRGWFNRYRYTLIEKSE